MKNLIYPSGEIFEFEKDNAIVKPHPLLPSPKERGLCKKNKNSSFIFTPLLRRGARGEVWLSHIHYSPRNDMPM
jgi:hypothetical protein